MAENTELVKAEEKTEVATHNNKVTDYSLGIFGTSDNFIMAMQMAKALAESTIVPQTYQKNPSNCLIAIEQAQRMCISPLMVMQNLFLIQNKPSWSSKFLIASINASNKFDMELQYDETKDKNGKPYSCTAWTMKNGRRIEGMEVNMQIADDEGWTKKNGSKWKTMPQLMLRYRAASFFSSLNCPELTMGLYTKEEIEDGDFKEYPIEDLQKQVKRDIAENANSEPFVTAEPCSTESAAVEPEKVAGEVAENDENVPDFMKD